MLPRGRLQRLFDLGFRTHRDDPHAGNPKTQFRNAGIGAQPVGDAVANLLETTLENIRERVPGEVVPGELLGELRHQRGELLEWRFDIVAGTRIDRKVDPLGQPLGIVDAQVDHPLHGNVLIIAGTRVEQEWGFAVVERNLDQAGVQRLIPERQPGTAGDGLTAAVANDVPARFSPQVVYVSEFSDFSHDCSLILLDGRPSNESVEFGGTMADLVFQSPGCLQVARRKHPAPERILVDGISLDGFVYVLQTPQREGGRQ